MRQSTVLIVMAGILTSLCSVAGAATLYWDGNTTGGGGGSTNDNWNTTDQNWDDAATWDGTQQAWTNGEDADFAGTAGTVTVTEAVTANSITFNVPGYTIGGASKITLGTGTAIVFNDDAGGVADSNTISAPIELTGNTTFQNLEDNDSGDQLIFSGVISDSGGDVALTLDGVNNNDDAVFRFQAANTFSGTVSIRDGDKQIWLEHDDAFQNVTSITLNGGGGNQGSILRLVKTTGVRTVTGLDLIIPTDADRTPELSLTENGQGNATGTFGTADDEIQNDKNTDTLGNMGRRFRMNVDGGSTLTVDAKITGQDGTSLGHEWSKVGGGTLILTNANNNFEGNVSTDSRQAGLVIQKGTVRITAQGALGASGTDVSIGQKGNNNGATLRLEDGITVSDHDIVFATDKGDDTDNRTLQAENNTSATVSSGVHIEATQPGIVRFNTGNASTTLTISGQISDLGTGGAGIKKIGPGKLILSSSSNNYTGDTVVEAGTLELSGGLSNTDIDVGAATFQGGSGSIVFDINGTATTGLITLTDDGGLIDISDIDLTITTSGSGVTEGEYVVVDYSADTDSNSFIKDATNIFNSVTNPTGLTLIDDTVNNQVKLVPEPATLALLAVGLLGRRRRRRRA